MRFVKYGTDNLKRSETKKARIPREIPRAFLISFFFLLRIRSLFTSNRDPASIAPRLAVRKRVYIGKHVDTSSYKDNAGGPRV